jgi:hypothetical protein
MLDVNNVLPTLYKDRKMKIINVSKTTTKTKDENENEDERRKRRRSKRTVERRKLIFKTTCVRWRVTWCGVSLLFTLIPIQLADRTGLTKENFWHNGNTIKYLKSPSVDAGDFQSSDWLSKTDETNETKRCSWVWQKDQTYNIKMNQMTQITTVHSLFFKLNVHSKEFKFPRGAMLLLVSLWLSNHWSFTVNQLIRKIT